MTADEDLAGQVRADLIRIYGPEVIYDALDSKEAQSYFAARREADAREAAYLAAVKQAVQEFADGLNDGSIPLPGDLKLPGGMRFERGL